MHRHSRKVSLVLLLASAMVFLGVAPALARTVDSNWIRRGGFGGNDLYTRSQLWHENGETDAVSWTGAAKSDYAMQKIGVRTILARYMPDKTFMDYPAYWSNWVYSSNSTGKSLNRAASALGINRFYFRAGVQGYFYSYDRQLLTSGTQFSPYLVP